MASAVRHASMPAAPYFASGAGKKRVGRVLLVDCRSCALNRLT
jgi:hypothetical protein